MLDLLYQICREEGVARRDGSSFRRHRRWEVPEVSTSSTLVGRVLPEPLLTASGGAVDVRRGSASASVSVMCILSGALWYSISNDIFFDQRSSSLIREKAYTTAVFAVSSGKNELLS